MLELFAWLSLIDQSIFSLINLTLANPVTDFIMPLITIDLHLKIFYAVCLALILWKGDKRLRFAVVLSLVTVALTDQLSSSVLKPIFARPRPCWELDVHLLVACGSGFSMPSSHAANLFGQAYFFRKVAPSLAKYLIPLGIIIALSRVFVGVHYPADILVGAALGTLLGLGVARFFMFIFDAKISGKKRGEVPEMSTKIEVLQGDITEADTETIVNAANNHLWMGSGVAGAIKRKGGEEIEKDAISKGPITVGEAVESIAGKLPYKYIIHAAGMGQDLTTDEHIVYEATRNSLLLAERLKVKSIAFPAIGTGVGGFPVHLCAEKMIGAARDLIDQLKSVERIAFVLFDKPSFEAFETELKQAR